MLSGLPAEAFESLYVDIHVDSQDLKVRLIMFGDQNKPVLLMTHGYASSPVYHFMLMKGLA